MGFAFDIASNAKQTERAEKQHLCESAWKDTSNSKQSYLVQCAEHTKQHLAQVMDIMELLAADRLGHIPSNNAL